MRAFPEVLPLSCSGGWWLKLAYANGGCRASNPRNKLEVGNQTLPRSTPSYPCSSLNSCLPFSSPCRPAFSAPQFIQKDTDGPSARLPLPPSSNPCGLGNQAKFSANALWLAKCGQVWTLMPGPGPQAGLFYPNGHSLSQPIRDLLVWMSSFQRDEG